MNQSVRSCSQPLMIQLSVNVAKTSSTHVGVSHAALTILTFFFGLSTFYAFGANTKFSNPLVSSWHSRHSIRGILGKHSSQSYDHRNRILCCISSGNLDDIYGGNDIYNMSFDFAFLTMSCGISSCCIFKV